MARGSSAWDLEMEFFHAAEEFYDLEGAVNERRNFGLGSAVSRSIMSMFVPIGKWATWLAGAVGKGSWYYRLRHAKWRYAGEHEGDLVGRQLRRMRLRDDIQGVSTTVGVLGLLLMPPVALVRRLVKRHGKGRGRGRRTDPLAPHVA